MTRLALLCLVGCAHPAVVAKPTAPPRKASPWPVPMRVMTWTPDGVVEVGMLPDAPPAAAPATPWYVEPTRALDDRAFAKVIAAVRSEHVPGLSLRGQEVARRIDQLANLPELGALLLDDTDVADPAVLALSLHRLYLARTPVDDAAVARTVAAQPALQVLDLAGTEVGDDTARAVAALAELRALNLANTQLTDAGGAALGALAHLEILDLGHTRVAGKTIAAIRPLALRELFLDGTRVGKEVATLAGYAPGLVRFDVSALAKYQPSDGDLVWLAEAPNLVELAVSGARVHDALAQKLVALPKLRVLRLADTPITVATIEKIAPLVALEELDLAGTPVDDTTAKLLLALPALHMLRLDRTPITDAGLRATPGRELRELYLSKTAIDDVGTDVLEQTPHLVALGLGETQIADTTIVRIAHLRDLRTVVLAATHASREALPQLCALHQLEHLDLDQTQADDALVTACAYLPELRALHLQGTDVSDAALPVLGGFARLEELSIGDTRIKAPLSLVAALPHLHVLSLLGLQLDDRALPELARHGNLVTLDLSSTEVTDPSALAALPHLHVLGLVQTKLSRAGASAAAKLAARGVEVVR